MEDNRSNSPFSIPGVAIIMLALGVFIYSEDPFNPTRPDVSSGFSSNAEDVRARLWQDPFEAVIEHKKTKHKDDEIARIISIFEESTVTTARAPDGKPGDKLKTEAKTVQLNNYLHKNTSSDFLDKIYQDPEHRICNINKSKLKPENLAHTYGELGCQIRRNAKADVHILAVMVPGGSYAEDHETRIRSRYALVSALSKADYIPDDSEHIGYMDFSFLCKYALSINSKNTSAINNAKYCDWPAVIPYEWFTRSNSDTSGEKKFTKALILWLDESDIPQDKPLTMLNRLRKAITPKHVVHPADYKAVDASRVIKFDALGPASSTTLVKMQKEAINESCKEGQSCDSSASEIANAFRDYNINIYSPRATLDEKIVDGLAGGLEGKDANWFKLNRMIPQDSDLVQLLLCELLARGVNPYIYTKDTDINMAVVERCKSAKGARLNTNKKQDHVVLIGEWDTVYSRSFNTLFDSKIEELSLVDVNWLHNFNYLRGIDGSTGKQEKNDKQTKVNAGDKNIRRPVGENQYDYLRRIGDLITDLNRALITGDKGTIRAIGVVGSDAYDKLLVLQALRNRFPEVIFFTTDLDVRMLHKEENKWVRNLVVASGHGISPRDNNNNKLTTFRDNYQTSLYLSVLKAIGYSAGDADKKSEDGDVLPGLSVTAEVNNKQDVFGHPISAKIFEIGNENAFNYSLVLPETSSLTGLFMAYSGYVFIFLGMLILLLYQANYRARRYTLVLCGIVALVLLILGISGATSTHEFKYLLSGTSVWPANIVRLFASFLAFSFIVYSFKCLKNNIKDILHKYKIRYETCDVEIGFWQRLNVDGWGPASGIVPDAEIAKLTSQYIAIGNNTCTLIRVSLMTVFYFLLTLAFLKSFPNMPSAPFHGALSSWMSFIIIVFCVLIYLFLVFMVVDVTRVYSRYVKLLSKSDVCWSLDVIKDCCEKYGVTEEVANQKLKIDMIVERSKVVDLLIFLPFIILTLMIVSRSGYFDHWHTPVQLAFVIILGGCIAISSAIRLRRTAETARKDILDYLNDLYKRQLYKEEKIQNDNQCDTDADGTKYVFCERTMTKRLATIISDIENIKEGPFVPISKHPIFSAVAMPFGGVGGLYLIDYVANIGI